MRTPVSFFHLLLRVLLLLVSAPWVKSADLASPTPNIIFVLADDLGYGELGCYGQQHIRTPHLDQMAKEGMRFTQFYAGATVCAPSRSVLMTGLHHGRTRVRGNARKTDPIRQALRPDDLTVAEVLNSAGYDTALIGKWGLGDSGAAAVGLPDRQGFGYFFGFLNQMHAHNHYPDFLWKNGSRVKLKNDLVPVGEAGAGYATKPVEYADDLFCQDVLKWIEKRKTTSTKPFFLYWTPVVPHANNERTKTLGDGTEVPDLGPYAKETWPQVDKSHAAMISRLDGYIGELLAALKQHGLAENTLVLFSSDNGPHDESKHNPAFFKPSGPYTGMKRSLTDGGIRVPFLAWWPGKVPGGVVSNHVGHFQDFLVTAAELAKAPLPKIVGSEAISFLPALLGKNEAQKAHDFLYWEFHENGFQQAALYQGRWKGHRRGSPEAPLAVYDLHTDPAETADVSQANPSVTEKLTTYLATARSPNPDWEPEWKTSKQKANP